MPRDSANGLLAFLAVARERGFTRAAATEAGERLLRTVGPAFDEIDAGLAAHDRINLRLPTLGGLYAWEFERGGRELKVRVEGQLVLNNTALILHAALAGFGLACLFEDRAQGHLADGRLVRVLADWRSPFPGYHFYRPRRLSPRRLSPCWSRRCAAGAETAAVQHGANQHGGGACGTAARQPLLGRCARSCT